MPLTQAPEHYTPFTNPLPDWLGQTSPAQRQALKSNQSALPTRIRTATASEHEQLQALIAGYMTVQNTIDQRLETLQDAKAFAEPILKQALKTRFGQELNVRTTFLRLYIPLTTAVFGITTGTRVWTVSLLEAALHNFEARETEATAFAAGSTFISQPTEAGHFDTLPLVTASIGIQAFTTLCRELDIGGRYKTYLEDNLGVTNRLVARVLAPQIKASQEGALRVALQLARMNRDIGEDYWRMIDGWLNGVQGLRMDGQALQCHDFAMMSTSLPGILVFAPDLERARAAVRVVAYVPDDPEHPIKEYASTTDMMEELTRQLRIPGYQRFFSRFVAHEQRGHFFSDLNQRLSKVTWHRAEKGSALPSWRDTPIDRPTLQFCATPIAGDPWQHLYIQKLNRILNDARVIAVPTATVDRNARWAIWDSFVNVASSIFDIALFAVAPFVPFLGEMLMAYMAYQLLNQLFEGVIEWAEGQTTEAAEHLWGAVEALMQMAAFGAGSAIALGELPKLLPANVLAFVDSFKAVKLRNGKTLYWKPDLGRYKHPPPANGLRPNPLGLLEHNGKHLLPIDQAHYSVKKSPLPGRYQIEHPTRPDAYQPTVFHNGDGAWHTEFERPLTWDSATALQRLGHRVEGFSTAERDKILSVSGSSADALRKMHVNREPTPPLLADSITRFQIDQDLQRCIDQLSSPQSSHYLKADPLLQLQALQRERLWPKTRRLQFVDERGEVLWQSIDDVSLPAAVITQHRLVEGDVLKSLLQVLSEREIKTLLGEEFAVNPTLQARTQQLRSKVVLLLNAHRPALFTERYQALEKIDNPLQQQLAAHVPQLPSSLTRELLDTATGKQWLQIGRGRLPQAQQELAGLADQELRVSRAYEGLELDSVRNPQTDTLALHSLARLAGWPKDLRLEIRDQAFGATLLDSSGPIDATVTKVLVRQAAGTYQPYDSQGQELSAPTDFYTSVLQALPDAGRQAVGIHIGEGPKLRQAIRANPLPRDDLRLAVAPGAIKQPAVDTLRLLGMDGYPHVAQHVPPTLEQRIRDIYPGASSEQIDEFVQQLQNHPDGPLAELARLHGESTRLRDDLAHWTTATPGVDPSSGVALTPAEYQAAQHNRVLFAQRIERCWRRESDGTPIETLSFLEPIPGDLPELSADFSHVSALELIGHSSSHGVERFLQRFGQLRQLDLRNFTLQTLPQSIAAMPRLRQLKLRDCALTLTQASQATLSSMTRLTNLDLRGNPLGLVPNVESMHTLTHLHLENTGISVLPNGLLHHPRLRTINLSNNQFTALPDAVFELGPRAAGRLNFAQNPLTHAARERIKVYYTEHKRCFGILPEPGDVTRVRALFPALDQLQASWLIYELPSTLLQGRIQVTQWESEVLQLTSQLSHWAKQLPALNPLNGKAYTAEEQLTERAAREAFSTQLENLWRARATTSPFARANKFASHLRFRGDLPQLAANFDHVTNLILGGSRMVRAAPTFFQRFAHLRNLQLAGFDLEQLPQILGHLPQLTTLMLNRCGVTITESLQVRLASLRNLESLALPHNPLGIAPDIATLPRLSSLDLSNTNLSQAPAGLANHPHLRTAILSENQITHLPEELFELPAHKSQGYRFANNPLAPSTRERIKTYARDTGKNFGVAADPADIEATRALFPSVDTEEASDIFYALPGSLEQSRSQLKHWKAEFQLLSETLTSWRADIPEYHPATGVRLSTAQRSGESMARDTFADQLIALWQAREPDAPRHRATSLLTTVSCIGDLPTLSVDFSHISTLALHGNPALGSISTFLDNFIGLQHLGIQNTQLGQLPSALTRMTSLESLNLNLCAIALTSPGHSTLPALPRLESLNLNYNPLGVAPDISALPALKRLSLSNTGISAIPDSLANHQSLGTALLNHNQISELPDSLFDPVDRDLSEFNFADNPLSLASREKVKALYARTRQDLGVPIPQADIQRAINLFPSLTEPYANTLLYQLPGTLLEGHAQLIRWEAELQQLRHDLEQWVTALPEQNPVTGQPFSPPERVEQLHARRVLRDNLEYFWRSRDKDNPLARPRVLSMTLPHAGDMPALSADFSFLSTLVLHGNRRPRIDDQFLRSFTGLINLEMHSLALDRLPHALTEMPNLEHLTLSNCGVVLDAEGHSVLVSLRNMLSLDLSRNPLGRTPDIQRLPRLTYLDLSDTGINDVPANLTRQNKIEIAVFTGNQISELPGELFELPAQAANGFVFENNPLSARTRERIKTYYRETKENFSVLAQPQDLARVQSLHPNLDDVEASAYFYNLPGTTAESRIALTHEEAELSDLTRELVQWASAIPNDPRTGQPLEAAEQSVQETHRDMFKEELLTAWRKWPTEDSDVADFEFSWNRPLLGELPTLGRKFKAVLSLTLINNNAPAPRLGGFLEAFPALDSLTIHKYDLGALPEAILRMSQLTELNLPECRISLTPDSIAKLGEMTQLNILNLRNNPLGVSPDLSNLQKLESLNLTGTGITEIPEGVLENHQFDSVNLANNQITEIPDALMQVPRAVGAHYNLRNNPFSAQGLATLRAYYHATGNTLRVQGIATAQEPPPLPVEH
jgi:Leucine-rich repeat (LRR) protein